MKVVDMLKKGVNQLQRKKRIRNLKTELVEKREVVSKLFLEVGNKISEVNIDEISDFEEVNSMHNVLSIIEKLENENLELEDKIEITKEDYNTHIDSYVPLIAELKGNLSTPQNKLISLKEKLLELKLELKESKDILKEKENIFKDTQDRLDNKSEEDELDEEKTLILEEDYKRLQKTLLEITHSFESKTEEYNLAKDSIKIVEEEIKTAEDQINNYKKEMGRLKKEKVRELDAIKKVISNNKNSVESRNKELNGIYRNIGELSFSKMVLAEQFKDLYEEIAKINLDITKITSDRQMVMLEADKAESFILLKFFTAILCLAALVVLVIWGIYSLSGSSTELELNSKNKAISVKNISCNRGEILVQVPDDTKAPFTVESTELFTKINKVDNNLKISFSSDSKDSKKEYELKVFSAGKELNRYFIKSKESKKGCVNFYMD